MAYIGCKISSIVESCEINFENFPELFFINFYKNEKGIEDGEVNMKKFKNIGNNLLASVVMNHLNVITMVSSAKQQRHD